MRPKAADHPEYYERYIGLVKQDTVTDAIAFTTKEALDLIMKLDPKLGDYAYAEGKWTIKQVLIHCIDTERIFSTRALGFARGETQKALSYDENIYANHCYASSRPLDNIAGELESVGRASLALFSSFSDETLNAGGETPSGRSTVNAIGFATCGHTLHHLAVIRERYLK